MIRSSGKHWKHLLGLYEGLVLAEGFTDAVHRLAQAGENDDTGRILGLAGGPMLLEMLNYNVQQGGNLRVWPRGGSHQMV